MTVGALLLLVACATAEPRAVQDPPTTAATGATSSPGSTARTESPTTTRPPTDAHATDDPTLVVTDRGPVRGAQLGAVRRFAKIPFAAPPIGDLRWRAPRPHDAWTDVYDSTVDQPACIQAGIAPVPYGVEDCLYLSVHAPAQVTSGAPVLVWLHGGGFTLGAPSLTDPSMLAARYGAVVVSPAYRLGAMGFVALDELAQEDPHLSTGSYGIADQQRALEWVQDNIAAFGGDPANVTIAGESAGGWSVCIHLVAPGSAGLFHRAISESGPCTIPLPDQPTARAQGRNLAEAVGCARGRQVDVACLRAKPAEQLVPVLPDDGVFGLDGGNVWRPSIDGWVLPEQVADGLRHGRAPRVPVIFGWNTEEGRLFNGAALLPPGVPPGLPLDPASFHEALGLLLRDEDGARRLEAIYPLALFPNATELMSSVLGDGYLKCPGRAAALALAAQGNPVFVYSFAYKRASFQVPITDYEMGAFHSAEIQFVFAMPLNAGSAVEQQLATDMSARWLQFAKTGDPNGGLLTPAWPRYTNASAPHLVFDTTVTTSSALDRDVCDAWDTLDYRWAIR